jgi:cation transport regulator
MHYEKIDDLPPTLKRVLPKEAQEIYLKAFNSALEDYEDPVKRRFGDSIEEVAERLAWSAVKKVYEKNDNGSWVKKSRTGDF